MEPRIPANASVTPLAAGSEIGGLYERIMASDNPAQYRGEASVLRAQAVADVSLKGAGRFVVADTDQGSKGRQATGAIPTVPGVFRA